MSITQTAAAQHPWSRFTQSGQANLPYPLLNHLLKGLSLRLLASRLRFPNLARLLSPTIFCLNPWVKFIILKLLASRRTFKQSGQSPRSYPFSIKSFITMSYSEAPGLQVRTSQLSGKGPQIDNVLLKPFMKLFNLRILASCLSFHNLGSIPKRHTFLFNSFSKPRILSRLASRVRFPERVWFLQWQLRSWRVNPFFTKHLTQPRD